MANRATSRPPSIETEESLIGRIRLHDQEALSEIYDRYASIVYSIALRVLRDQSAAEQLMQEVFIQIWRNPDVYNLQRGPLCAWLAVVARNRAIDKLRRRKPECGMEDVMVASHVNFRDSANRIYAEHEVRRAMRSLPVKQRRAVELAFFEGLTPIEIAASTCDSLDVVNTGIRSALVTLGNAVNLSAGDPEVADSKFPPTPVESK